MKTKIASKCKKFFQPVLRNNKVEKNANSVLVHFVNDYKLEYSYKEESAVGRAMAMTKQILKSDEVGVTALASTTRRRN